MDKTDNMGSASLLAPVESLVMAVIAVVPVPQLKIWISAYFHPVETYESQKAGINSNKLGIELAIMSLIPFLIILVSLISLALKSFSPFIVLGAPRALVVSVLSFVFGFIISALLLFILAKILGGKAGFYEHAYSIAMLLGGYYVLTFPFYLLSTIPDASGIFRPIFLLIGIYNIYNFFVMMRHIHQLSSLRAAMLVAIPIIVAALLFVAALLLMLGGMLGGLR